MLELRNIIKHYGEGNSKVIALDGINLEFKRCEFVSVLGPSGCGKTTLLNIIGGLDRYTEGDLIINNKSTKNFADSDWDSYRNNSIGFVFQNYNLIPHLNVLENVELSLILSGMPDLERKAKAKEVLAKVGLSDQLKKRPNQLSGGQMQRVAIARAMVNDPDIILADEPTGALDSATSIQIMELLQEISKERLIIMVTHNSEIADRFSTRIIRLLDGKLISDIEKTGEREKNSLENRVFAPKKSAMSFLTSLKLSFKNLLTKRARTLIISFAGSIGIIGIALVLAISTGFSTQINSLQSDSLAAFPLTIDDDWTLETMPSGTDIESYLESPTKLPSFPDIRDIILYDPDSNPNLHLNVFTDEYVQYVEAMDSSLYNSISYRRNIWMNVFNKKPNEEVVKVNTGKTGWQEIISNPEFLTSQYDVLEGSIPLNRNQMVLIVDKYNRLNIDIAAALSMETEEIERYSFSEFIGMQLKLVPNDVYYYIDGEGNYKANNSTAYSSMYENPLAETLEIVGILRIKSTSTSSILRQGIAYSTELTDYVMESSAASAIAIAQSNTPNIDVRSGGALSESTYNSFMRSLGVITIPDSITIYPVNLESKDKIKQYLDQYNATKADAEKIICLDVASIITNTMGTIIDGITYILVAFAAISLLVSSIMIGIITYISVLERTKEIGVLRSLGARKMDISRVFNAETLIIGFSAGFIGVVLAALLSIPINIIVAKLVPELAKIATLKFTHALLLILISMTLTVISGLIPAVIAAKRDPVVALRTE